MSSVLEPAGRGVELSISWLRNDFAAQDLIAAFRSKAFLPLFDAAEWPTAQCQLQPKSSFASLPPFYDTRWKFEKFVRGIHIGRKKVENDWRIGTVFWQQKNLLKQLSVKSLKRKQQQQQQQQHTASKFKRPDVPPMLLLKDDDKVVSTYSYEILRPSSISSFLGRPLRWQPWQSCCEAPPGALIGGRQSDQPLYIARAVLNGCPLAGEFAPHRQAAYFVDGPSDGLVSGFDVLVFAERSLHPDIDKVFRV